MTGLTPGAYYSFSVTAENAVSSQDKNATIRSAKVTATMEEGGTLCIYCTCTCMYCT